MIDSLSLSSDQLRFSLNDRQSNSTFKIEISNSDSIHKGFKIKTSNRDRYRVSPTIGVIKSFGKIDIEFILEYSPDITKTSVENDRFCILVNDIPEDLLTNIDIDSYMRSNSSNSSKINLKVKVIEINSKIKSSEYSSVPVIPSLGSFNSSLGGSLLTAKTNTPFLSSLLRTQDILEKKSTINKVSQKDLTLNSNPHDPIFKPIRKDLHSSPNISESADNTLKHIFKPMYRESKMNPSSLNASDNKTTHLFKNSNKFSCFVQNNLKTDEDKETKLSRFLNKSSSLTQSNLETKEEKMSSLFKPVNRKFSLNENPFKATQNEKNPVFKHISKLSSLKHINKDELEEKETPEFEIVNRSSSFTPSEFNLINEIQDQSLSHNRMSKDKSIEISQSSNQSIISSLNIIRNQENNNVISNNNMKCLSNDAKCSSDMNEEIKKLKFTILSLEDSSKRISVILSE